MWRKILVVIILGCFISLVGCKKKSLNQVYLEADKNLSEYKELLKLFSGIENLKSAGDNVNGYWKTGRDSWSKVSDSSKSINLRQLCSAQGLKDNEVKWLQKKLDTFGVMRITRKGSEIYLLIERNGLAHPGGTAFYAVFSNKPPNELYGESKKMLGESNWWVMEVK